MARLCSKEKDSLSLILGIGEFAAGKSYKCSGGKAGAVKTLPYPVDLSAGRRDVLLYTDFIYTSSESEYNSGSSVLKTFLVRTLYGINNFVFAKLDWQLLRPSQQVNKISLRLKLNTAE